MRLGLPPLGIIGIPLKITGNQDKPKVGVGRKTDELEETEDEEKNLKKQVVIKMHNDNELCVSLFK